MPFCFLHTADWQLGMTARLAGTAAARVRQARLEAAQGVIDVAAAAAVDVVILAGDTFEDSNVPRPLVQKLVDILRKCPSPVLVLPGNHDPLVPGSVFDHPAWRDAEPRVRVLRDPSPVAVGEADFLPCPIRSKTSPDDPLAALPAAPPARDRFRIGVAHGSLLGAGVPGDELADDFPLDRVQVTRAGLDYLALGHWHTPSTHEVDGVARIAYCGTHEPTKFGEVSAAGGRAAGQCLVVTLDSPGAPPRIEARRTAVLEWRELARRFESVGDLAALRRTLDTEDPTSRDRCLLRLTLTGSLSVEELTGLDDLETLAGERFLHARVESADVSVRPADDRWIGDLPPGAPQAAAQRLLAQAEGESREARVAREALHLLYDLHREAAS